MRGIPLLIVPLLIYNLALLTGEIHGLLALELFSLDLVSGALWVFTVRDALIAAGVLLLTMAWFAATRVGRAVDPRLSAAVAAAYGIEFVAVIGCGTSTFLLLGLMAALDAVVAQALSLGTARRNLAVGS